MTVGVNLSYTERGNIGLFKPFESMFAGFSPWMFSPSFPKKLVPYVNEKQALIASGLAQASSSAVHSSRMCWLPLSSFEDRT